MLIKHLFLGALTVAIVAVPRISPAADSKGQFGIRGAGLVSCAVYVRERKARSAVYDVVAGWMDGYITGVNQYAHNTYDAASFESTELFAALVNDYCKQHPDKIVFSVVNAYVKQAWKNRLRSPQGRLRFPSAIKDLALRGGFEADPGEANRSRLLPRTSQQRVRTKGPASHEGVSNVHSAKAHGISRSADPVAAVHR